MKQTFFKKNNSARLAVCLVLFIPLIAAVISAIVVDPNSVTVNNLKTVEVTPPGGIPYEISDENGFDLYSSISDGAKEIDATFREFSLETPYIISFNEGNAEPIVYEFYASANAKDCVYLSPNGKYYLVAENIAERIITRNEFASIDTAGLLPVLTVSALEKNVVLSPDSFTWTFTALDGSVSTIKDDTDASNPVIKYDDSKDGRLSMEFDRKPDSLSLVIEKDGNVVFNDKYENLDSAANMVYDHDQKLSARVIAEWYEIEGAEHFGKAEFSFDLLYDVAPEYSILNKSLPTGEFTVLSITNFNDGELLTVESELGLPEKIKVYDYKDIKIALIPLVSTLEAKDYEIKLKTELGQTSSVKINVSRREDYESQTLLISDDKYPELSAAFTQEAIDEFDGLVEKFTLESANEQFFTGKNFEYPTGSSKVVTGGAKYGMDREVLSLNADGIKYTYGQDMDCVSGQSIKAANNGIVVYAGETALFGNTVIIDHGYGILSYYGNLDSISVSRGDETSKGSTILGKAGSTGFACVLDGAAAKQSVLCHYAVSMGGRFIAPRSIYSGIYLP